MRLDLRTIAELTGNRFGTIDTVCPLCCADRRSPANRRRRVLRIWRETDAFATFCCARCGASGYVRDDHAPAQDPAAIAKVRAETERFAQDSERVRRARAQWLWSQRRPIADTIAERYLRDSRGYPGPIPATLGFLPARDQHPPAMIAAFGVPTEPEPGSLATETTAVQAVHLTRLRPDGSGKAGTAADKIIIGTPRGSPIVLAPVNDGLGLAITEGIEDALSVHAATGLGAWAAGAASFMPALAPTVPSYVEAVTICADADAAGKQNATSLTRELRAKPDVDVRLVTLGLAVAA